MMYDVCVLGESLIDFVVSPGTGVIGAEGHAGGAPLNVGAAVARYGMSVTAVTKVGNDIFGRFIIDETARAGVDTSYFVRTDKFDTTLALVSLSDEGERSFDFYRRYGADTQLDVADVPFDTVRESHIFHFGSVSMTHPVSKAATLAAAKAAREGGALVSFDPNYRPVLWDEPELAREAMLEGLSYADIVKVSDDEMTFITGEESISAGVDALLRAYNIRFLSVTCGARGCRMYANGYRVDLSGHSVKVADTTGAGDAFDGAVLYYFLNSRIRFEEITEDYLHSIARFANAAGALTTTKAGAIPALPTRDEVLRFLDMQEKIEA